MNVVRPAFISRKPRMAGPFSRPMPRTKNIELSICISTFNRAAFIGATLESIIAQATNECEIVVIDGGSTDNTAAVVSRYAAIFERLKYVRQHTNNGVDRDFDRAVELAVGEYCWLFSDDDFLKPGAVESVLHALRQGYSLILVNGEHRDFDMQAVRVPSFFGIDSDCVYASSDMDRMFADVGTCLICICCVIIKRDIWLARERQRYFGTRFIHIGVIFQKQLPADALLIARPMMSLRLGNEQTWKTENFQVWYIKWPSLVWSLCLADTTKRRFCAPEPWRRLRFLLALRAMQRYSLTDYHQWIRPRLHWFGQALVPAVVLLLPRQVAHLAYVLYSLVAGGAKNPYDAFETMLPKSMKVLQKRTTILSRRQDPVLKSA